MAVYPRTRYYHSGSFAPSGADWYISAEVYQLSQNYPLNTSTVRFVAYVNFVNQPSGAQGRYFEFQVSGDSGSNWNAGVGKYIAPSAGDSTVYLGTRDVTWNHNSLGQLGITSAIRGGFSVTDGGTTYTWITHSSSAPLSNVYIGMSNIPTVPTISNWLNAVSSTNVIVGCALSNYTNVQYSFNGGAWTDLTSTPYTLSGLSSGTSYTVQTRAYKSSTGQYAYGSVLNFTTSAVATIPTVSPTSADIGVTEVTISMNPSQPHYTHTLYCSIGGVSNTIVAGVSGNYEWTPPTEFLNQIINSENSNSIITAVTYDGSTIIGSATANLNLIVPTNIKPTSTMTLSEESTTLPSTFEGLYVKGYSTLGAVIGFTGAYSSTVTLYELNMEGAISTNTSGIKQTRALTNSGDILVKSRVKDSRQRYSEYIEQTITVYDYYTPKISNQIIKRVGVSGQEYTTAQLLFNYDVATVNNLNTKSCTYFYRLKGTSEWTSLGTITLSNYLGSISQDISTQFNQDLTYEIKIEITDEITTTPIILTMPAVTKPISVRPKGEGITFGKSASESGLHSHYDSTFHKALNVNIDGTIASIFDWIYPVNTGFIAYDDTDYSDYLGFTWEKTCIGRVAVGKDTTQIEFDTIGETGGHKALQAHNHPIKGGGTGVGVNHSFAETTAFGGQATLTSYMYTESAGTGNGGNLQPYQVVNYWKRTV